MDPVTLSMISMGIGSAVKVGAGLFDDSGAKQAQLMREQAQMKMGALEETMRRAEGAQTQTLSSTKARMAGTGFSTGSDSFTGYLQGMADQFTAQNASTATQGMQAITMIDQAAKATEDAAGLGKLFKVGSDIFGSVGSFASLARTGH